MFAIGVTAVFSLGRHTPPVLGHHSRGTRLSMGLRALSPEVRGCHPLWPCFPARSLGLRAQWPTGATLAALALDSSLFVRHYWGNPCWFLFLPLMICLSSGGSLAIHKLGLDRRALSLARCGFHRDAVTAGVCCRALCIPYLSAICVRESWFAKDCVSPWVSPVAALFLDP